MEQYCQGKKKSWVILNFVVQFKTSGYKPGVLLSKRSKVHNRSFTVCTSVEIIFHQELEVPNKYLILGWDFEMTL